MRQIRIRKQTGKTNKGTTTDRHRLDLRTPSGRVLPY
jgi:hypothetical protein